LVWTTIPHSLARASLLQQPEPGSPSTFRQPHSDIAVNSMYNDPDSATGAPVSNRLVNTSAAPTPSSGVITSSNAASSSPTRARVPSITPVASSSLAPPPPAAALAEPFSPLARELYRVESVRAQSSGAAATVHPALAGEATSVPALGCSLSCLDMCA